MARFARFTKTDSERSELNVLKLAENFLLKASTGRFFDAELKIRLVRFRSWARKKRSYLER